MKTHLAALLSCMKFILKLTQISQGEQRCLFCGTRKPKLFHFMQRIYGINGIAKTVNIEHIKAGYYSIKALNPKGIVPNGPEVIFEFA